MRIKLKLEHRSNSTIPINYAYPISAMIYKMLEKADPEFSKWLHEHGWSYQKKHFKLFTFSRLSPTYFRINGDRITLIDSPTYLTISFMMDEAMGHFIEGLFSEQKFSLGDRKSRADFQISSVDILSKPDFSERMKFKLTSPIVISHQKATDKYPQYLHPIDDKPIYTNQFFGNLLNRYVAYNGPLSNDIDLQLHKAQLKILTKPSSKLITIKKDTPQQTKVRGYVFDFEIIGSPELLEVGYYSGFGEKGSTGFGFADLWE